MVRPVHSEAECTFALMSVVGDRVEIRGEGGPQADKEVLLGTVRFVGEAAFAPGEWLGLELDRQVGKNNGSVKGKAYFQCEPGHGIFVRPHCVTKVSESTDARNAKEEVETTKSEPSSRSAQQERYLVATVQPLAIELVSDVLGAMPEDPESFMMRWLRQRAPSHQGESISLRERNRALKEELSALQGERETCDAKARGVCPEALEAPLVSEVGTSRAETAADLTTSLEAMQVRLVEQVEEKVGRLGEQLEARMLEVLSSKVEELAASLRAAMGAASTKQAPGTGSEPASQGTDPKTEHAPKLSLREKFGLADSKYDGNIVLLDREDGAAAKYAKALEISGGQEKLRSFRQLSTELQKKHGLGEEQEGLIPAGERAARSVKVNFQPFFPTLDELFEFAHKHMHHFFALVSRVATKTNGTYANPPLKGKERCESKARFKYMDSAGNVEWHRLTDIVRDTLSYESLEDMYHGLKLIDEDESVEIVEFNDRYQTPLDGGYRDLQLTLRVQGKLVCELQLTTKYMLFIKESSGHRVFEIKRQLIADVAANSELECRKTLKWAGKDAEAVLKEKKRPLLHKAASQGNSGMVQLFIQHGADVDLKEETTLRTALHEAMGQGHACAAWALISAGARQDVQDADGQTPLLLGLLRQRVYPESEAVARCISMLSQRLGLEELRRAREEFGQVVEHRLKNSSELVSAAYDDNVQKVVEHLRNWANPNSATNDGKHALHRALAQGHTAVARQLLTYKADVWLKENDKTALDVALEVTVEKPGSLELLVDLHEQYKDFKNDAGLTFLMLAVKHGNAANIKQLLDKGMEKDARCVDGSTALMLAAREGKTESLGVLLDREADKDCQDNEGHTALMLAMHGGHEECFKVLLDRDAKRGQKNSAGKTVLELTADNAIFRALLGPTALMEAARDGHVELVKELLENGAEKEGEMEGASSGLQELHP
ncbi:ANKRD50 [Symbiodinium sp. CCMP2592]|nr:ANKRD50 [Symbiodinium sp. CCMP2592]